MVMLAMATAASPPVCPVSASFTREDRRACSSTAMVAVPRGTSSEKRPAPLRTSLGRADELRMERHGGRSWGRAVVAVRGEAKKGEEEPLRVMIAGAPASGKGTQCELIAAKFGLTHISAGDLLRAEIAAGTEAGMVAKDYMNEGKLVPSGIVVAMVKNRLAKSDARRRGWLLDGYPRSLEQAEALEAVGIRPQLLILLDVAEEHLVGRVVGRRLDPVTGKIYHLTYEPPETPEVAGRLVQRFDDREEKVKARVKTHLANVEDVIGVYKDVIKSVDGNRPKMEVFADIFNLISALQKRGSPAPS